MTRSMMSRAGAVLVVTLCGVVGMGLAGTAVADGGQGAKFAFIRDANVWTMGLDGQNATRLTTSGDCSAPAWSPDGAKLVYVRGEDTDKQTLWIYDLATKSAAQFTSTVTGYLCPQWSPDGTRIACFRGAGRTMEMTERSHSQLLAIAIQTKQVTVLTADVLGACSLAWAPDSAYMAYAFGPPGKASLWIIETGDGKVSAKDVCTVKDECPEVSIPSIAWRTRDLITFSEWIGGVEEGTAALRQVTAKGTIALLRKGKAEHPWLVTAASNDALWVSEGTVLSSLRGGQMTKVAEDVAEASCQ